MSRAILRALTGEDYARIRAWQADEELNRIAPIVRDAADYEQYAIDVDGNLIGYCSIYNVTPEEAELGIIIGQKDCWGKGYGTDVVNQLTERCLNHLGLKRVHLRVLNSNVRAIRCYEKCGFTRYGVLAQDGHSFSLMQHQR